MKHVFVVAESALLRKVLKIVLEKEGYDVDLVGSPEGIRPRRGETFPLMIVDGQRGTEAEEVMVAMQRHEAHVDALIFLSSGGDDQPSAPWTTLAKPLDLRVLQNHVRAVLSRPI